MAARKRAPGAGRPKKLAGDKKSQMFTTRIGADTKRLLEEAAAENKRSVSAEAETALRNHLKRPEEARNRALASIVALLAESIEQQTGRSWRTDSYTAEAVRFSVITMLKFLAPAKTDSVEIPPDIERRAARMPDDQLAALYRVPERFGIMRAEVLIDDFENRPRPGQVLNEWTLVKGITTTFNHLDSLARALELK
jgi:plasmid stability protein